MGVHEGHGQLAKAMKTLMMRWLETRSSWNDVQAGKFEERYLELLEKDIKQAAGAMDHAAVLLSRINRDCR